MILEPRHVNMPSTNSSTYYRGGCHGRKRRKQELALQKGKDYPIEFIGAFICYKVIPLDENQF